MTTRSATRSTRSITVPTSCGSNARIDSRSHRGHDHEDAVTPLGRHAGASPITESGPDPVLVDTARWAAAAAHQPRRPVHPGPATQDRDVLRAQPEAAATCLPRTPT